jgi:two-component system NtrC family sensor kinase
MKHRERPRISFPKACSPHPGDRGPMNNRERIQLHKILKTVGVVTLLLLAGAWYLGFTTARLMKGIIRDQFNQQQLVLAKAAALRIEANVQNAIADLILLNALPVIQYSDKDDYETLLLSTLPVLSRDNIIELRRVDREGNTLFVASEQGISMELIGLRQQEAGVYLSWASTSSNRGKTMATGVRPRDPVKDRQNIVMDLIVPTYEDATNARHQYATHRFSGYLGATLNVSKLLLQIIPPIRSGKTGYAWVLDSSAIFLHHPEASFIGENAFEIRNQRNPNLSFMQINQIQREEMLKGKEGIGTYFSGWHRELVEPMEKLIAYAPVRIQGPFADYHWSVAVVAPVQEIEAAISSVYERQAVLQTVIVFIILLGSIIVLLYELRWSTVLESEVAAKTEDIRRYAQDLERSEAQYRSLVESAEDLIYTLDSDGLIQTANHHMAKIFGVGDGALNGQSLYRYLPREQADEQLRLIQEVVKTGRRQRTESLFQIQGQELWFNLQYIPIRAQESEAPVILGIARDMTDRKSLERQLINAEKLASLGTLAAGVAHEINNPLGIMLGFCDLLLEKIEPGTMEYNDLKTIERHGLHCKSIVDELLSFARITDESEEHCDVNASVDAIVSVVRHTANMNSIDLKVELAEGLPRVRGDSRGLQQVLLNLINNAIFAMSGSGALAITTRSGKLDDHVEVRVQDNGCGIPKEFMEKIFDPFFTTKKVGDGTGLGLFVSYGIIAKFGGTVTCESHTEEERPGESGTTFTISLPVASPELISE